MFHGVVCLTIIDEPDEHTAGAEIKPKRIRYLSLSRMKMELEEVQPSRACDVDWRLRGEKRDHFQSRFSIYVIEFVMSTMQMPIATTACLRYLRKCLAEDGLLSMRCFQQQRRGKKFVAKVPPTVKVRLLEDIKGYGARGMVMLSVQSCKVNTQKGPSYRSPQGECGISGTQQNERSI